MFDVTRLPLAYFAGKSLMRSMRGQQMATQTHVQGDCHAHNEQCAYTQNQEPPDHSHNRLGYQMIWQGKQDASGGADAFDGTFSTALSPPLSSHASFALAST